MRLRMACPPYRSTRNWRGRKRIAPRAAPRWLRICTCQKMNSVLALDTYRGEPQLAILQQTNGELNRQTAHNILRQAVNPLASAHQLVEIKGETAPVQLHVPDP